jgi:hypothetical protein
VDNREEMVGKFVTPERPFGTPGRTLSRPVASTDSTPSVRSEPAGPPSPGGRLERAHRGLTEDQLIRAYGLTPDLELERIKR